MGYDFLRNATRQDVVAYCVKERPNRKYLKHCLSGNILWAVMEHTEPAGQKSLFIECFVLVKSGGEWGYKAIGECQEPAYYSCPLSYLDMVPLANATWRQKVREYHSSRNRKFNIGDVLVFASSVSVPQVRVTGKEGSILVGEYGGQNYRIPRRVLAKVIDVVKTNTEEIRAVPCAGLTGGVNG